MSRTKKIDFIITVFFSDGNPQNLSLRGMQLFNALCRDNSSTCIHWTISASILEELRSFGNELLSTIKKRVCDNRDLVFLQGFTGGDHALLELDELKKEISWGFANPWETGLNNIFERNPAALVPETQDHFRKSVQNFYSQSPYMWLEIKDTGKKIGIVTARGSKSSGSFPAVFLERVQQKKMKKLFRELYTGNRGTCFVILNANDRNHVEKMQAFWEAGKKYSSKGREIRSIQFSSDLVAENPVIPYIKEQKIIPHTPFSRFCRREGTFARFTYKNNPQDFLMKKILFAHKQEKELSGNECFDPKSAPFIVSERSLFANMPGTVSIAERNYEIHFENGRLCSILVSGNAILKGTPVNSFITTEKKVLSIRQSNTFSFEDDRCRGLREVAVFNDEFQKENGQIITDYFFTEDSSSLFISLYIRYPVFPNTGSIKSFAPIEIPIFTFKKHEIIRVQGFYPGGESYTQEISSEQVVRELPGLSFIFSSGKKHLFLSFPCVKEIPIHLLPMKVVKEKDNFSLYCNPMGSYRTCRSSHISGWGEHFNLILRGSIGEKPFFEKTAENIDFLEPSWVRWFGKDYGPRTNNSPL